MLRYAVLFSAALLICGCQGSGQQFGSMSPFGTQRVPPPGTNGYPNPQVSYPTGSNPAGASGAVPNLSPPAISTPTGTSTGAAIGAPRTSSLNGPPTSQFPIPSGIPSGNSYAGMPTSLFGNGTVTPASLATTDPSRAAPPVRFGDSSAPPAQSSIRLNGMTVNDATQGLPRSTPGYPEITNLPSAVAGNVPAGYYPPAGYNVNNVPGNIPAYVPPYTPGSTNTAAGSTGTAGFGWKSAAPTGTSSTLR